MPDVTIRGAGIFGLSIAWACLQRGARVQVIDPGGVGAGSSGGIVGALAPHTPENWNSKKAFQLDSLLLAGAFWAEIDATSGLSSGYARSGRLQPIPDETALERAKTRGRNAETLWQGKAVWEVVQADRDWAPLSPTGYLIHDTLSARIHPRQACAALAAAFTERGGRILSDAPDQGAVIWATGAHGLDQLSHELGRPVGGPNKGQAALLQPAAPLPPDAPQIFADTVHVIAHADGTIAIGSTSEPVFDDPAATDGKLDAVIARARAAVPALHDATLISTWAGLRPRSRSRAPVLGTYPGRAGHFIANGGFKIGFGMAPRIATVMADLVLDGADHIPDEFRLEPPGTA